MVKNFPIPVHNKEKSPEKSPEKSHDKRKRSQKKLPMGIYLRGESYYYRQRVPKKWLSSCGVTEIRFSLQTDSFKEAKRKCALAMTFLHTLFEEKGMVNLGDLEEVKDFIEKTSQRLNLPQPLKNAKQEASPLAMNIYYWLTKHGIDYTLDEVSCELFLQLGLEPAWEFDVRKFDDFLKGKDKIYLEPEEIMKRFVGYYRWLLHEDSRNIASRVLHEERKLDSPLLSFDTPKTLGITQEAKYGALLGLHKAMINNAPLLCYFSLDLLEKFVAQNIVSPQEVSHENHLNMVNEYCKVSVEFLTILQERLKKNYSYEEAFLQRPYTPYTKDKPQIASKTPYAPVQNADTMTFVAPAVSVAPVITVAPVKNNITEPLLSFFLHNYLETKVKDGKKDARYIPELQKHLEIFIAIMGDKAPSSYTRAEFRHYRDSLQKLPPNFTRRKDLKDIPIHKLMEMPHAAVLSDKTINSYLTDISAFFSWLVVESYLEKNYASGLGIKEKQAEIDAREPFSLEDIRTIFTSKKLQAFRHGAQPSRYWVPWIGLYTGMRLEEICQLHCADIRQEDGIWVIDINDKQSADGEKDKKLKSVNANRMIPVHAHLLELGFLEYLSEIKNNSVRLFPDLKVSGNRNQYGKMITKWFPPFTRSLGVTGKKSFHSLRHSFSDFYKKQLMHNEIFEQVFGHAHGKLATRRYGERFSPKDCYERLIVLLDYGLFKKDI